MKSLKADVSSVNPSWDPFNCSYEELTLETSAFKLFTEANLRDQLSW